MALRKKRPSTRESNAADELTRTRLLEAAGVVFAAEGFHWAKVRDICARAGANVAAVNYHFGDKLGLYKAVLSYSMQKAPLDTVYDAKTPEAKLHAFVRTILESVFNASRPSWSMKLILHEMSHTTPAFDELVQNFIRPRYRLLCEVIGGMIGEPATSRLTQLCAHSVVGQARHYLIANAVIEKVWTNLRFDANEVERLTDHITTFSVAGIKACARQQKRRGRGAA